MALTDVVMLCQKLLGFRELSYDNGMLNCSL